MCASLLRISFFFLLSVGNCFFYFLFNVIWVVLNIVSFLICHLYYESMWITYNIVRFSITSIPFFYFCRISWRAATAFTHLFSLISIILLPKDYRSLSLNVCKRHGVYLLEEWINYIHFHKHMYIAIQGFSFKIASQTYENKFIFHYLLNSLWTKIIFLQQMMKKKKMILNWVVLSAIIVLDCNMHWHWKK